MLFSILAIAIVLGLAIYNSIIVPAENSGLLNIFLITIPLIIGGYFIVKFRTFTVIGVTLFVLGMYLNYWGQRATQNLSASNGMATGMPLYNFFTNIQQLSIAMLLTGVITYIYGMVSLKARDNKQAIQR